MLKLHASVYPTTAYKIFIRHIAKSRIYLPDGPVNNNCINDYLVLPRLRCQDFSPHGHFAPWTLRFRSAIPGVRHSHGPPNPNPNPIPNPKAGPWEWRTPGMGAGTGHFALIGVGTYFQGNSFSCLGWVGSGSNFRHVSGTDGSCS